MSIRYEQGVTSIFKKALGYWYWYILCLMLAGAGAWYSLVTKTPMYFVGGSIIVEEDKNNGGSLPEEAIIQGLPFRNKGNLDRQIQVLKSRNLMEKVVDSLRLDIIYLQEGRFRNKELYNQSPVSVISAVPKQNASGITLRIKELSRRKFAILDGETEVESYEYGVPFPYYGVTITLERKMNSPSLGSPIIIYFANTIGVAAGYSGRVTFQKQAQSNVLSVGLVDAVPQKSMDIIYKLVEVYNLQVQEEKNRVAEHSLRFIDERLSYLSSELFQVESNQASFKTNTEVPTDIGSSAQRYLNKLSSTEESVEQIRNLRTSLQNLRSFLSDLTNKYQFVPSFGDLGAISLNGFLSDYNKIIAERENLLRTATTEHPAAKQIEIRLNNLRNTVLQGVNLALEDLDNRETELRAQAAPIQQKVRSLPFVDQQLTDIKRKIGVKDELVLYMLQKREETAIGLATTVESTRILDSPISSGRPVSPNKTQTYMLAFVLAMAIPTGTIFLVQKLNDKISTRADVKVLTSLPYLGDVAYAKRERGKLISSNSRSNIAEMFRLIRTSLDFITADKQEKVILVTSQNSGDGKTFISGNLGAILAMTNKRTVLVELDLRKPKLAEFLLNNTKEQHAGVTNYLVGEKKLDEILQPVDKFDNLFVISAGPVPPNPAELIMGQRMKELVNALKQRFDYIVIDTPPIGLVTDAYLLKSLTAVSIFVVRSGKTKKQELQEIEHMGMEDKLTSPVIVLNGVKMPKKYGYYY
jgi:capsular exopolysaccharide synthesis family protein